MMLIQKINACFCLFVGIWPREALPAATSLRKIQLELALDFFFFFLSIENVCCFCSFINWEGGGDGIL